MYLFFFWNIFYILDFQLFNDKNLNILVKSDYIFIFNWYNYLYKVDLINTIAECLYSYKWFYFIICALILFLSMIGAIFLTKNDKNIDLILRSQLISKQVFATFKNRITLFYKKNI